MKILITGPEGQIGWELVRVLRGNSSHEVIGIDRSQMDLTDPATIRSTIRETAPEVIINAAGYTAVDRAESEPELAQAINTDAVGVIGEEAMRTGAAVVHYSTDYIFDGTKTSPYQPDDPPNPLSVYGQSKLGGECALMASGAAAVIVRTSWIYAARGKNFLLTILRNAATKPELRIVNDQVGCPTSARAVALATVQILAAVGGAKGGRHFNAKEGIYHAAASGSTTWFEFARAAIELAGIKPSPRLVAITTADFAATARRPLFSVLNCDSTAKTFKVLMADWRTGLQDVIREAAACAALSPTSPAEVRHEPFQPTPKATATGTDHQRGGSRIGVDRSRHGAAD